MKIAMAFSGGGYRAATFNLGTISYLNKVKFNGDTLLKEVVALSTVSGGTITGARYAIGIKRGETFDEIYLDLYKFFSNADLITGSVQHLKHSRNWNEERVRSLINAFADLYDTQLFDKEKFGLLLDEKNPIHLKHISFNATEFTTGLQFRFQVSEKIESAGSNSPEKGLIGNYNHNIPEDIAKEIRMADILAASSCFPGGFEPINFPCDFVLPERNDISAFKQDKEYPLGLMDGGIVDNQGIEPLLLAENRMKLNNPSCSGNCIDLIIISDVSSPYMEGFKASTQGKKNWWRGLTLKKVRSITTGLFLLSAASLVCSILYNWVPLIIIATVFLTVSSALLITMSIVKKQLNKVDIIDIRKIKDFLSVEFLVFENLIKNRVMAVMKLTGSVFMKHIRRLNFRSVYQDDSWKNRRISNTIYELRAGEKITESKFSEGKLSQYLKPSAAIQEVSRIAASMGTTLWFEEKHVKERTMDSLIACGQYNICWNLLEYIENIKLDDSNTNESHKQLLECEEQLKKDWERFKENPYWMVSPR